MSELVKTVIPFGMAAAAVTFTAATGADYFVPDNADGRVALIVRNAGTQNAAVTLKAGDGALSALGDVKIAVAGNGTEYIPLERAETARVKVMKGADSGRVMVDTSVDTGGAVGSVAIGVISVE